MAQKKANILAFFVQEMYVILFGIGLGNIIFLKKIDISSIEGIGSVLSALFVIGVTIRYWLDWASYISGEVRSTNNEFIIDFGILLNLLLLFGYYQSPETLSILFFSLSVLDGFWVINYTKENPINLQSSERDSSRWILEKVVGTMIFFLVALVIWMVKMDFLLQLALLVIGFIAVRKLSFRSVKKAGGLEFVKATPSDLNVILKIHNENAIKNINRTLDGFLLSELNEEVIKEKLEGLGTYEYFLAKQSENVVGFLQIHEGIPKEEKDEYDMCVFEDGHELTTSLNKCHKHVLTVAVSNDYKSAGIGSFLYKSIFERHEDCLFSAFVVVSPNANQASVSFHLKHDFRAIGSFEGTKEYHIENYKSVYYIRS